MNREQLCCRAPRSGAWSRLACLCAILAAFVIGAPAQDAHPSPHNPQFINLVSFNFTDGWYPFLGLVQGFDGNLYGTTLLGGTTGGFNGTFYRVTPAGAFTTLYNFCPEPNCPDGSGPGESGSLALGPDGNFYGTTENGGASAADSNNPCFPFGGCGTIYKMTPDGTPTTLYNFCSQPNCVDGDLTYAGLVLAADGNFYGTTPANGANSNSNCYGGRLGTGCGTVYRITPAGDFKTIYSFCALDNCADGTTPYNSLTQGADGYLYGMTSAGGANGFGTIFKISLNGNLTTLHSFDNTDGDCSFICAPLVQATNGKLYGAAPYGGPNNGPWGTIFEITPAGNFTNLYNFCAQSHCPDGAFPQALTQGSDGNLYGGANAGADGPGTIFKLTLGGSLTTVHSFDGVAGQAPGGANPVALIQASNGTLYGNTTGGGLSGNGVVFSLNLGLAPTVETVPMFGRVGSSINILGSELANTTGVSFGGTPAVFTIVSSTLITATVPAGASSGFVTVSSSKGELKSNAKFHVRP